MSAAVSRSLLSIETEKEKEKRESVELFSTISRSLSLKTTAVQAVDCLCLLDARDGID